MKILFVDDESKKLKRLYSAISQIEGINPEDLENVLDLKSAKEKLVSSFYDLVVMDLKISEYIAEYAEDESEIAGLEFIDEILGTDAIRTPQEIVILTEHDELQKTCTELGKDLEFQVLKYDEQSLEWENIIKSKVKYRLNYEIWEISLPPQRCGIIRVVSIQPMKMVSLYFRLILSILFCIRIWKVC